MAEQDDNKVRRRAIVVHPFLLAVWPVLFVYSQNLEWVPFSQTWAPGAVLLGTAMMLFLLLAAILRDWAKAGAVLSLLLLLFFSFGHVYSLLSGNSATYAPTTESLMLMIAWTIIFAAGSAIVLRMKEHMREVTSALNAIALTLILIAVVKVGAYELGERIARGAGSEKVELAGLESVRSGSLPDIYYIVLDSYGREDMLEDVYRYDNSEFSSFLESEGFYVAGASLTNYAQTDLSLASSLNLQYLDGMTSLTGSKSQDRRPLEDLIQTNRVIRFLDELGYTIVNVPSGFNTTELRSSDVYLKMGRVWNELDVRLLSSTPIPWLAFRGGVFDPYAVHRQKILFALNHIAETARLPGPKFVFSHVLAPHGPFVFDENGNERAPEHLYDMRVGEQYDEHGQVIEEYVQGYTGQLAFISIMIGSALEDLIAQSSRPTVVILQSDHGPGGPFDMEDPGTARLKQKMTILNAYLFPDRDYDNLYQEITPVNTFRVIFNQYLGTDMELLEDRSYYSTWQRPYRFVDVTDRIRSGED